MPAVRPAPPAAAPPRAGQGLPCGRRALLAAPLVLASGGAGARPAELRFRVVRNGSQIGTHRVTLAEAGEALTARTEVDILVKVLGITAFRLSHRFEEVWARDRLRSVTSRRDRNGTVTELRARAEEGAVLVEGSAGRFRLPAEAAPLSWWDSRRFGRPLFDNDTGAPLQLRWTRRALPGGGTLWQASGGGEESEGTYAADGTWTGWKTRAEDGSTVTYEPA